MHSNFRPWRKWYKTKRWQGMRARQLSLHPLCAFCLEQEIVTPANVADHIMPHKGNSVLFWDPNNIQSLCKSCHDKTKQRIEAGQTVVRFGPDGWPLGE